MNNLQRIIENDTRAAMHMAVELCEQGDFDSVTVAFKWLMQEHCDSTLGGDVNSDGLPVGLTISEDGSLLNWRGENYVRQSALGGGECDVVKSYGKHSVTNNDVVLYNCSKCGKWIGLSANYCGNCGARIRKAVER